MGRRGVRGHEGPRQMRRGDVERGLHVDGERKRHANRAEGGARLRALARRAAMRAVHPLAAPGGHGVGKVSVVVGRMHGLAMRGGLRGSSLDAVGKRLAGQYQGNPQRQEYRNRAFDHRIKPGPEGLEKGRQGSMRRTPGRVKQAAGPG